MTKKEILEMCINKQLEPHSLTYNAVFQKPSVDGEDWFIYYTFNSKEQFESWKSYCITLFMKELKQTKSQAEREFDWLNLMYGLKQEYVKENA